MARHGEARRGKVFNKVHEMKALTISQPYASLIASGEKFVENRRWETKYRGPLAIHAGKGKQYLSTEELKEFPVGCVVAVANLTQCIHIDEVKKRKAGDGSLYWEKIAKHEYTEGPWCWFLQNIRPMRHQITWKGAQGLWDVSDWSINNALDGWIHRSESLPPAGIVVETKIDDSDGVRNEGRLKRGGNNGRLWFVEDGSLYVYYVPTHWRSIQ